MRGGITQWGWKGIAVVVVVAMLILGAAWYFLFRGVRTDDNPPVDSAGHPQFKPGEVPTNPAQTGGDKPPGKPAEQDDVHTDLKETLDALKQKETLYWNPADGYAPVTYNLRPDRHDLHLQWLYYEELVRLYGRVGVEGKVVVPRERSQKTYALIKPVRDAIGAEHPERHSYNHAYTQWYELVCHVFTRDDKAWDPTGESSRLFNEVVSGTASAGGGRATRDGSTMSAQMYGALTLYFYADRQAGRIGERLGVNPKTRPAYAARPLVQLLTRATGFVEECYGGNVGTGTLGLRYHPSNPREHPELAGGKILYHCSKAVLARQNDKPAEEGQHLAAARRVAAGFVTTPLPRTPYGYSYVLRATAILIRTHVVRKEWNEVKEVLVLADKILKDPIPGKGGWLSSDYYLPLSHLQLRNELLEASVDPAWGQKKDGGPKGGP